MEERLKKLRKELNMNQKVFAKSIGLGQSTWAMIEVGKRELTERHIKTICAIHDVNEDWLRTGTGEMFKHVSEAEEIAIYVSELLENDHENPLYDFILEIMRTYAGLDSKSQEIVKDVVKKLSGNLKKEG